MAIPLNEMQEQRKKKILGGSECVKMSGRKIHKPGVQGVICIDGLHIGVF